MKNPYVRSTLLVLLGILIGMLAFHFKGEIGLSKLAYTHTPPATAEDLPRKLSEFSPDTHSPIGITALYYKLLGEGNFKEAAKYSTNPVNNREVRYIEQLSAADRATYLSQFRSPGIIVQKVVSTKDASVVVMSVNGDPGVSAIVKIGDKYRVSDDPSKLSSETQSVIESAFAPH